MKILISKSYCTAEKKPKLFSWSKTTENHTPAHHLFVSFRYLSAKKFSFKHPLNLVFFIQIKKNNQKFNFFCFVPTTNVRNIPGKKTEKKIIQKVPENKQSFVLSSFNNPLSSSFIHQARS